MGAARDRISPRSLPRLFPPNPESAGSPEIRFAVTASRPLPPDPTSAKETAEDVRRILAEALAAAGGDAPHLVDNMMRIARIQSDAGLRRDSEETIAALLERVRQTKDSRQRALALCKIVEPQGPGCGVPLVIPAGDGAAPPKPQPVARASSTAQPAPRQHAQTPARPILQEAISAALKIENGQDRDAALLAIAYAQNALGLFAEAIETVRRVQNGSMKASSMVSLAALRKGEDARRILAEVFAAARSMDHADDRRRILSHIASVQIDASLFPDALATVRAQDDLPEKAKDFCRIADAQITTGCKDQAGKTLAETLPLAGRVAAPWRDDVFEEIAASRRGQDGTPPPLPLPAECKTAACARSHSWQSLPSAGNRDAVRLEVPTHIDP